MVKRSRWLRRLTRVLKGGRGRGKRAFAGFAVVRTQKIKKVSGRRLQGETLLGIWWPIAAVKKHLEGKKPAAGKRFTYRGQVGVLLPKSFGMVEGCAELKDIAFDGVDRNESCYDGVVGDAEGDEFWKEAEEARKVKVRAGGKANKSLNAPAVLQLMTGADEEHLPDDHDVGNPVLASRKTNPFAALWGCDLFGAGSSSSGDVLASSAVESSDADSSIAVGIGMHTPPPPKRKLVDGIDSTKREKGAKKGKTHDLTKVCCASEKVLAEVTAYYTGVVSGDGVFDVRIADLEAMEKKLEERLGDDLEVVYFSGYEEGSDHVGNALWTRVHEMLGNVSKLDVVTSMTEKYHPDDVSSWHSTAHEFAISLLGTKKMGVAIDSDRLLTTMIKAVGMFHLKKFDFKVVASLMSKSDIDGVRQFNIGVLEPEPQGEAQLNMLKGMFRHVASGVDQLGKLLKFAAELLEADVVISASFRSEAVSGILAMAAAAESRTVSETMLQFTQKARDSEHILANLLRGSTGRRVISTCIELEITHNRELRQVEAWSSLVVPSDVEFGSDDEPVLPNHESWETLRDTVAELSESTPGELVKQNANYTAVKALLVKTNRIMHDQVETWHAKRLNAACAHIADRCRTNIACVPVDVNDASLQQLNALWRDDVLTIDRMCMARMGTQDELKLILNALGTVDSDIKAIIDIFRVFAAPEQLQLDSEVAGTLATFLARLPAFGAGGVINLIERMRTTLLKKAIDGMSFTTPTLLWAGTLALGSMELPDAVEPTVCDSLLVKTTSQFLMRWQPLVKETDNKMRYVDAGDNSSLPIAWVCFSVQVASLLRDLANAPSRVAVVESGDANSFMPLALHWNCCGARFDKAVAFTKHFIFTDNDPIKDELHDILKNMEETITANMASTTELILCGPKTGYMMAVEQIPADIMSYAANEDNTATITSEQLQSLLDWMQTSPGVKFIAAYTSIADDSAHAVAAVEYIKQSPHAPDAVGNLLGEMTSTMRLADMMFYSLTVAQVMRRPLDDEEQRKGLITGAKTTLAGKAQPAVMNLLG